MTVLDRIAPETCRESSAPVLESKRLVLRAPREGGDHVVFLEDGLTLEEFLRFLDTLPAPPAPLGSRWTAPTTP